MSIYMMAKCCLKAEDIAKSNDKITGKLFADGDYGINDIFECLAGSCIYHCTKARRNARVRPKPATPLETHRLWPNKKTHYMLKQGLEETFIVLEYKVGDMDIRCNICNLLDNLSTGLSIAGSVVLLA